MLNTNSVASATGDAIALSEISGDVMNDLISKVRAKGAELRELLKQIELHVDDQHLHAKACGDVDEMQRLQDADPYRWHDEARRSLQAGLMFLVRAAEQPKAF
jgi:hypothetical protein